MASWLLGLILFFVGNINIMGQSTFNLKKKSDFISQEDKEQDKIIRLKVKVRYLYSDYYVNGEIPKEQTLARKEVYNKKGLLVDKIEFSGDGYVDTRYMFTYDSKGRPIKGETYNQYGKIVLTQVSKYDSKGNEIERVLIETKRKKTSTKTTFKYDSNNNLISVKNYSNKGILTGEEYITYKNGKRDLTLVKDASGKVLLEMKPEYNSMGKLVKDVRKNSEVNVAFTYKYDEQGNMIEMIDHETKRYYSFNSQGNVTEHKLYLLDGRRQLRMVFTYNDNGLQNEQIRYDNDEKPVIYAKYEYEFHN